jgi:hypothetical protein
VAKGWELVLAKRLHPANSQKLTGNGTMAQA